MPQDQEKKHQYEHAAQIEKAERADALTDDEANSAALHADNHTGQQGMLPPSAEAQEGSNIKALYTLLPEWHKDELRRLTVVPRGTRLSAGDVFIDLRVRDRGELVAHGEEEVHDELLVAKRSVDYEIWNKLKV